PDTSLFSFTLCVPARNPAWYQRDASCSRCLLISAPNTASASSTEPTFLPSRLTTSTTGIFLVPYPKSSTSTSSPSPLCVPPTSLCEYKCICRSGPEPSRAPAEGFRRYLP